MKITKEQFEQLCSDDITKREYDRIIGLIDDRFGEICKKIIKRKSRMWFDYGNCDYESEDSGGYFDPIEYREQITIGGEYVEMPEPYGGSGDYQIPTRWLWEDFEEEFAREVEKDKKGRISKKEADKLKRETRKKNREELILRVKQKLSGVLSKEEMKILRFVK